MTNKVNYTENNLRKIMVEKGMSQKNLAYCIGVTYQQVHKYVKGTNQPNFQTLMKMAEVLNCKIREIYPLLDENELMTKNAKNVTIHHNYYNGFWGKLMKMDPHLLKNQIVYWVSFLSIIGLFLINLQWYTIDKSDYWSYIEGTRIVLVELSFVSLLALAIIHSLVLPITFLTYIVSYLAYSKLVFRINHILFDVVVDDIIRRMVLTGIAVILAIIWVYIAKRIRNKI